MQSFEQVDHSRTELVFSLLFVELEARLARLPPPFAEVCAVSRGNGAALAPESDYDPDQFEGAW